MPAKRGPRLYIRSWPTTRLIRVSFIPHMFTFSLSFAMVYTGCEIIFILKYPFVTYMYPVINDHWKLRDHF